MALGLTAVVLVLVAVGIALGFPRYWVSAFEVSASAATFVMVLAIQHTQGGEAATQRKLDELLRALPGADASLMLLEEAPREVLLEVEEEQRDARSGASEVDAARPAAAGDGPNGPVREPICRQRSKLWGRSPRLDDRPIGASGPHGQSPSSTIGVPWPRRGRGLMGSPAHAVADGAAERRVLAVAFGLLAGVLVAYIVAMWARTPAATGEAISGWGVDAFELVVALVCLSAAIVRRPRSVVAIWLGCSLLAWCFGDIALTIESLGGKTPPSPSVADAFYLAFYPLAYVAIVLFIRTDLRRLTPPNWLDGAVAGLGAAAVCSAFAFRSIVQSTGGHALSAAVNVAYPLGDLLLLALVVGGTAILPGRLRAPWLLLAGACALNAVGDTFNLFQSTLGDTRVGTVLNAVAWPGAFLLMAAAVWVRPRPSNPAAPAKPTGFALPAVAAAAALAILLLGTLRSVPEVSVALAAATLVLVGIRLAISARRLRLLTDQRHRQSLTDDLTLLGNRRRLSQVLDGFFDDLARPVTPGRQLAFLFLDLDHFKSINDAFGHPAGDQLLRQLGPRLRSSLRDGDVLVRLGGDEFAIVLVDADGGADHASEVAGRLLAALARPFLLEDVSATVGASIGIAMAPAHATDAASLLRCADVAMYRAKHGPDSVEVYDPDVDDDGDLLRLAEEVRVAVRDRHVELYYQPQLDLRTGVYSGTEALLRWDHPRLGQLPPLRFLPVAEEAGLMPSLTAFVLDEALRQGAKWRAEGELLDVALNISPTNLLDAGFSALIRQQLDRHRLPAEVLVLEITENCIISDYERSRAVIAELAALGLTISIDDFGAGVTSLAYLRDLAVGELKLDRTFISGLASAEETRDLELVKSTIDLGHALGLRVVAEGVEDLVTLQALGRLGCDLAQGFYLSRPLPAGDLAFAAGVADWAEDVLRGR